MSGNPPSTPGDGPAPGIVRVAVDAMGGDHAPAAVVDGCLLALERHPEVAVDLVGDRVRIEAALGGRGAGPGDRLRVVHASQVLEMAENPVAGLKAKPDNSISRCLSLVREGRAAAAFSAGNTGGMVAAATLHLERIPGVRRPGIAVPLPTMAGPCLIIDVGANIQCRPVHLLHYALMAAAYASGVFGIAEPRVGVLNIGEEESKGTSLVRETAALIRASGLRFVGNVEGHGLFHGVADVVVCDGFVGNTVLKTTEGAAECILALLKGGLGELAARDPRAAEALAGVLHGLRRKLDYAAHGGAPLLGFQGVVLIGHGRSNAEAVANAVRGAAEFAGRDATRRIREAVAATGGSRDEEGASPAPAAGSTA